MLLGLVSLVCSSSFLIDCPLVHSAPSGTAASLIDPAFLFRFEFALKKNPCKWTARGVVLSEQYRVPSFGELGQRDHTSDLRMAWCDQGLAMSINVSGKRQAFWCRDSRVEDSDSVHLWIDTRCSPGIHRASQYCHHFAFMPAGGGGGRREDPAAVWLPINRARANPKTIDPAKIKMFALPKHDGYTMSSFVPRTQLTGFDPANQPRISLFYAIVDRELGTQTLSLDDKFPYAEDPTLWAEAVLADD